VAGSSELGNEHSNFTERHFRVVSNPSYSEGPGFKSRSGYRLS
jgi:hypothetical protein